MKKFLLPFLSVLIISLPCAAQKSEMFIPINLKKMYSGGTRSLDGRPGPNYWQNGSDYKINATFDPEKRILNGNEEITYRNNSPNKISQIVIRLYPDIFRKDARRTIFINPDDLNEGVSVTKLIFNGEAININRKGAFGARKIGTNLIFTLEKPLEAKKECKIEIDWSYAMPLKTQLRGGMYSPNTFMISYWYPQIAVYDDIEGWDKRSYEGTLNFYNDYNNYDVSITVPGNYVIWGTGVLQNEKDNFSEETIEKINKAKKSGEVCRIITKEDIEKNNVTKGKDKGVWHYKAENVNDFVFAAGSEMLWDALNAKMRDGKDVFVSAIYNKDTKYCEDIAGYAQKIIEFYSTVFPAIQYPYPAMTAFNHSGGGGMEYPMMVNDGISQKKEGTIGVTAHEISHTYMPFYIGANEERYAWMDEGWATMATYDGSINILPGLKARESNGMILSSVMGQEGELPQGINSDLVAGAPGSTYSIAAYPRAAVSLDFLRNALGDDLFIKAFKDFADNWHSKHPTQYDFFFTFNRAAEQDLSWFWIPWFFKRGYPDIGIKNVRNNNGKYEITIEKEGVLPVPVVLTFFYEDGAKETINKPVTVWKEGNREYKIEFETAKKAIKIELGNNTIPDVDKSNNVYVIK